MQNIKKAPIIRLKSITKFYESNKVLDAVSLDIELNTINIIIGPNAAGKSSLAKIIAGIETNFTGEMVRFPDLLITYLPQKVRMNQYLPITTQMMFAHLINKSQINDTDIMAKIRDFCKIDSNATKQVSDLSGGGLQKLFISSTLARKSDVIILDEPTQHLDVQAEKEFYELIMLMKKKLNATFILISHDIHMVLKFADQIICLNNHICCTGSPKDIDVNDPFLSLYKHYHNHSH